MSKHNLIVYEIVKKSELCSNDIYKSISNTDTYKKILAVLEIRKMVPINDKLCTYIKFDDVQDSSYKNLLEKEYRFLKPHKQTILKKAAALYEKQKKTGIIESYYCNFEILENAYKEYCSEEDGFGKTSLSTMHCVTAGTPGIPE